MGSTATDDAAKPATDKAAKRQGKHQSAPATTTTAASGTDIPAAGASKKTLIGKDAGQDPASDADPAATTASDPRSLAWMSAQAVSALNAVREHQAEQARELLARVEKPPARHTLAIDPSGEHPAPAVPEAADPAGTATAAMTAPPPPARDRHEPQSAAGAADAAAAPVTVQAPADAAAIHTEAAGPLRDKAPAPPATTRKPRSLQPALLAAVIAVTGLLIYWSWPDTNDAVAPAALQEELTGVDAASIVELPRGEVISVVPSKPAVPVAAPADDETLPPATEPALPEPIVTPSLPVTAQTAEPVSAAPPQDKRVPAEAAVAPSPAPPTAVENSTGQASIQPAAPVAPAATPRARTAQPRYQAPAYGQYPQQPGWQQPHYRPAYPQYPSR